MRQRTNATVPVFQEQAEVITGMAAVPADEDGAGSGAPDGGAAPAPSGDGATPAPAPDGG